MELTKYGVTAPDYGDPKELFSDHLPFDSYSNLTTRDLLTRDLTAFASRRQHPIQPDIESHHLIPPILRETFRYFVRKPKS